jgi:hypothetical protein
VDVRVEKQPLQRNPLLTKDAKGIDRARRTAEVKKDFHKTTVYLVCLVYLVFFSCSDNRSFLAGKENFEKEKIRRRCLN